MEGHGRELKRNDVRREVRGVQGRGRRKDRMKGRAGAKKQRVKSDKPSSIFIRRTTRRDRNENVFARPNGLREKAEKKAIPCR